VVLAMDERTQYWLELADYDLETAKVMLSGKRYLYVGFMCHQTIEKAIKSIIARNCAKDEIPPKIHDLSKLAIRAKLMDTMSEEQQDFIEELNPLNIEARYPEYKEQIIKTLTSDRCKPIIEKTEGLLCWIKEQL
jgi:HEPN domain-containing protein